MIYCMQINLDDGMYMPKNEVRRSLEVPGSATLEDFCLAVLNSIDFDFDHLYSFYVNGREYAGAPLYASGKERCRVKLYSLGLRKGDRLTLVYDYGDSWEFTITVSDVLDGTGTGIKVTDSVGTVEQYPDEEDWDDEDAEGSVPEWDYVPSDSLFEKAFLYKKTKLWKKLESDELFAVRFSDGQTGYVSIMGQAGDHCAVGVFPGKGGLKSFRDISFNFGIVSDYYEEKEMFSAQNCLQVVFDNKEYLRDEELEAAKTYCSANGIRLSGKNAYPHFMKFAPGYFPWHPQPGQDESYLIQAVQACMDLKEIIGRKKPEALGFVHFSPDTKEVPYLVKKEDRFVLDGMLPLPEEEPVSYPVPEIVNDLTVHALKKIRKKADLQCRIIQYPQPVVTDESPAPCYPMALFSVDAKSGMALSPAMSTAYRENPDEMMEDFLNTCLQTGIKPGKILVEDERTYAFLKPAADALKIRIEKEDFLEELEEMLSQLQMEFDDGEESFRQHYDELMEMLEMMLTMPAEVVRTLPGEIKEQVRQMIEAGALPANMADQLRKKLKL